MTVTFEIVSSCISELLILTSNVLTLADNILI